MAQTDFIAAIKQIAAERGIDANDVIDAIKHAIRVSFKKDYPEEGAGALEIDIDSESGHYAVYADKKVVEDVTHPPTQLSLQDAQRIDARLKLNDHVLIEITNTGDFGRVAASAARQVITQLVREAEKEAVLKQFADKIGTVMTGVVQRVDREGNILVEINRATAKLPVDEQIEGEYYRSADQIKIYLKEIQKDARGKILIVSRNDADYLRALFEMEVPEIASQTVEIMGIAREAGSRAKVAVRSNSAGVDPIGACVGQRGARINAITNETKGPRGEEKIDIIPWDEDASVFIANSIRPAESVMVRIVSETSKQAVVIVKDEDLSLAIGREGQNVRLAAKLTGWNLDIQGEKMYAENKKLSKFEIEGGLTKKSTKAKEDVVEQDIAPEQEPEEVVSETNSEVESDLEGAAPKKAAKAKKAPAKKTKKSAE